MIEAKVDIEILDSDGLGAKLLSAKKQAGVVVHVNAYSVGEMSDSDREMIWEVAFMKLEEMIDEARKEAKEQVEVLKKQ